MHCDDSEQGGSTSVDVVAPPASLLRYVLGCRDLPVVRAIHNALHDLIRHKKYNPPLSNLVLPEHSCCLLVPPNPQSALQVLIHSCCVVGFD